VLQKVTSNVYTNSAIQEHKVQLLEFRCWHHLQKHIFLRTSVKSFWWTIAF